MRTILICLLLLFSASSKADTITHWTVYLNGVKLKTFTELGNNISFKATQLKAGDKLSVQYFDDMPCSDCTYEIVIRNEFKIELATKKFKKQSELVDLDLTNIFEDNPSKKPKLYLVFFKEFRKGKLINGGQRLFTFTIN